MAVIGDHRDRVAIVARQHALHRATPVRLEGDLLADKTAACYAAGIVIAASLDWIKSTL